MLYEIEVFEAVASNLLTSLNNALPENIKGIFITLAL